MGNNGVLILTVSKDSMTYSLDAIEQGYLMSTIFKERNKLVKLISKIDLYTKLNLGKFFFNSQWKSKIHKVTKIIIVAHPDSISLVKYVSKYFPNICVNVWYNNPVKKEISPELFKKYNCKVWSFDKKDSDVFDLFFNGQYVDIKPLRNHKQDEKNYDVVFIGQDKGRLKYLLSLKDFFDDNEIVSYYHIIDTNDYDGEYDFLNRISYSDVIKIESSSKAILEINQEGQNGNSLRALEALVMGIKLITNNADIREEPYYNEQNIFILENDNLDKLPSFLSTSFSTISDSIIYHHTFEGWISKFKQ